MSSAGSTTPLAGPRIRRYTAFQGAKMLFRVISEVVAVNRFSCSVFIFLLVFSASFVGEATTVEAKIGTEPSLTVLVGWDVSPNLSLAVSLGFYFGGWGIQTDSTMLQTPPFTIGLGARYQIGGPEDALTPYLGVGGHISFQGAQTKAFLEALLGVRFRLSKSFYLLGEVCWWVPVPNVADWHWSLRLGAGVRLRF